MRTSLAALLLAALLFASPSFAAAAQLTPRQRHLIDELMDVIHVDQLSTQMFDAIMNQMQTTAVDQKEFARYRELARQQIDFNALVREIYATVYARYFTDEDLEALIAFNKTPTGQKAVITMPKVMTDVMTAAQTSLMPKIMEIYKQIESEEKQERTTKGDLRKIGRALSDWTIGEDGGYPRAADINDLAQRLQTYAPKLPTKDVWGHPYAYAVSDDGKHYRVVSAGSDGALERDTLRAGQEPAATVHYSDSLQSDIIFGDGHFIALPKSWPLTEVELRNDEDSKAQGRATGASGSTPPRPGDGLASPRIIMAAEHGDAEAQYELGLSHELNRDFAEGAKWYRKAAEQGSSKAQGKLAFLYASGEGVAKDDVEAAKWTRKAAEQGDPVAQSNLGAMYGDGKGVDKDFAEEVKWYRKAADQSFATAQFNLAYSYEIGEGVTKDLAEAAAWYRKAADQGFPQAQFNFGNAYRDGAGVRQDFAEAVKWYRKAAGQQYAPAIVNLGLAYQRGEGVTKDSPEGIRWYRKAADLGSANAEYFLGASYAAGDGVGANPDEAVNWYRKAAAQGDADFQYALGASLLSGDGVKKDETEGRMWLEKAAAQGHAKAKELLSKQGGGS